MTSAKQGPYTDIYGLSATLYHAITGHTPPSAFDRMLNDSYEPLAKLAGPGFAPGICAGIDAGLRVVASDRPQSIAGWRPILGMTTAPASHATVVMGKGDTLTPQAAPSSDAPPVATRSIGLWVAVAAVLIAILGGSGYYVMAGRGPDPEVAKAREEAAQLRAESERRQKAEQEAAESKKREAAAAEEKKQFEAETRRKIEADIAEQKRLDEETKRKAAEELEARRKATEFVTGNFDHFGRTLLLIGLSGRPDEIRLQGVDIVDDPAVRQLAVNALTAQKRHLRCRHTDRLTDGTPLYRCLITQLNAKDPLDQISDGDRVDLALALVRNGLVLASPVICRCRGRCSWPRSVLMG